MGKRPVVDRCIEEIARLRDLIEQAAPQAVEEVKWREPSNGVQGVRMWPDHGIICAGEACRDKVKGRSHAERRSTNAG
ncbi:MAG: hypothetical protein DYG94_02050 [Leptolyngbya sp. PLA3]|nr:MAG: hypothetical protein EDM82_02505 [Cyanobacteria bacterium CYA]MCE7967514.1 hypothetical protein [Leptolyngbya sp. PL-A3]